MKRLLVGTDGSTSGQVAVAWAASLARATECELVVATAWQTPSGTEMRPATYDERREEDRRVLDDEWCTATREAGTAYEALFLEGDPREALLAAAADTRGDLVVVGARGTSSHPHAPQLSEVAVYLHDRHGAFTHG